MRAFSLCILVVALAPACGPAPDSVQEDGEAASTGAALRSDRPPAFRDVEESFTNESEPERWYDLKRGLVRDFDDICGDTFCEGDFTNLAPLSFRCSVSTRTGLIKSCLWLFAGSYETVTASTGNVRPVAKFFHCSFAPAATTPMALAEALLAPGGRGPLWRALPGSSEAIYDVLGRCL